MNIWVSLKKMNTLFNIGYSRIRKMKNDGKVIALKLIKSSLQWSSELALQINRTALFFNTNKYCGYELFAKSICP